MGTHLTIASTRVDKLDAAGNEVFEILTTCTDEGDVGNATGLPDRGIFLLNIFNSRNAQADIFERICSINDLEAYLTDRDAAIAANQSYWRADTTTKTYDAITTAKQAVIIISDRINTLVNEYAAYIGDFKTDPSPETSTYPTADPTYIESLKTVYTTKVEDYETAEEAEDDAKTARDTADTTLTTLRDSLKDWQQAYDKVCGGNLSDEGNEYGLSPYVTIVANAFKDLFNNSGIAQYDTFVSGTGGVKDAMDTFISSVENVQLGCGTIVTWMKRLEITPGIPPLPSDIGRKVLSSAGGNGYLTAYDLDNDYWWVGAQSGDWGVGTGTVTIVSGSTATGSVAAATDSSDGPLADLPALVTSRDDLATTIDTISITDGILATATAALTDATDACQFITDIVDGKATGISAAESNLNTTEATYIEAQAATQVAYDVVTAAYEAVKAVCPDWTPDPPVPAHP